MNKKEFMVISTALIAAYPNSKIMGDIASLEFWYKMLQDIDYQVAENAAMEYISTSVYPPSIAEIRRLCVERCNKPALSFEEAWGTVQKAISSYGRDKPDRAYATMDDLTASVVKNLGWNHLCLGENQEANRANFRMAYEDKVKQLQIRRQMPRFVEQQKMQLIEQHVPQVPQIEQQPQLQIETEQAPQYRPIPKDVQKRLDEMFGRSV